MPNKRAIGKALVGGYVDIGLKNKMEALTKLGWDQTSLIELGSVRLLLENGIMTQKELEDMIVNHRIKDQTIAALQGSGLLGTRLGEPKNTAEGVARIRNLSQAGNRKRGKND